MLGPNTTVTVNGTSLTNYCNNISIEATKDEVEVTGFGESYREFTEGLRDASINATFVQDYTTVDPCLAAMDSATTAGTVKVNPDTSSTVIYTLISKLYNYSPVSGAVGDANTIDVTFRASGTTGLTRSSV